MSIRTPRPFNLIAELTYRCPLRCAYCSNPVNYAEVREALNADVWSRVFSEAAALGVLHVGLTGGEPTLHPEVLDIVRGAARAELYSHLVTAGTTLDRQGLEEFKNAGLRSVQLSIQDSRAESSDAVAGVESFDRKIGFAADVRALDLPLILNVPLHRNNLEHVGDIIDLAAKLGAHRVELANTQYNGWALHNRASLMPTPEQLERAERVVEEARARIGPRMDILWVLPDYFEKFPKPCSGGWGLQAMVVAPNGDVMPCHGASVIPELDFANVRDHDLAWIWTDSDAFNRFRGTDWMPEPCQSCDRREIDFGGCRCQAFLLTGNASATDPVCHLSPDHHLVEEARKESRVELPLVYRSMRGVPAGS